jgi:predicted membrane protein
MSIQFAKGFMLSTFHGSVKFEVKTPYSGKFNKIQNKNKEKERRKRAKKIYIIS